MSCEVLGFQIIHIFALFSVLVPSLRLIIFFLASLLAAPLLPSVSVVVLNKSVDLRFSLFMVCFLQLP